MDLSAPRDPQQDHQKSTKGACEMYVDKNSSTSRKVLQEFKFQRLQTSEQESSQ